MARPFAFRRNHLSQRYVARSDRVAPSTTVSSTAVSSTAREIPTSATTIDLRDLALDTTQSAPNVVIGANLDDLVLPQGKLPGTRFERCSFARASLQGADLAAIEFFGCTATNANFDGANLDNTMFVGSDLSGSSFANSSLRHAVALGGSLARANLVGADLTSAVFSNVDLRGANLAYAVLANAAGDFLWDDETVWPAGFVPIAAAV